MSRGRTLLTVVALALVAIVAARSPWLRGSVSDAVLGRSAVAATGGEAAPGLVALTLAAVAAVVAALVTRRVIRRVVLVIGTVAAGVAAALAVRALLQPAAVLGPMAARAVGREDTLAVTATVTTAARVGTLAVVVLTAVVALVLRSSRRWSEPSAAYERGTDGAGEDAVPGARGQRVRSDWDALSAGHDPTDVPGAPRT